MFYDDIVDVNLNKTFRVFYHNDIRWDIVGLRKVRSLPYLSRDSIYSKGTSSSRGRPSRSHYVPIIQAYMPTSVPQSSTLLEASNLIILDVFETLLSQSKICLSFLEPDLSKVFLDLSLSSLKIS